MSIGHTVCLFDVCCWSRPFSSLCVPARLAHCWSPICRPLSIGGHNNNGGTAKLTMTFDGRIEGKQCLSVANQFLFLCFEPTIRVNMHPYRVMIINSSSRLDEFAAIRLDCSVIFYSLNIRLSLDVTNETHLSQTSCLR